MTTGFELSPAYVAHRACYGLISNLLSAVVLLLTLGVKVAYGDEAVASPPTAVLPAEHRRVLVQFCIGCHNADKREGGVQLDDLPFAIKTSGDAERWQYVLNVLNSGEMPPQSAKPVDPGLKLELLSDLSHVLTVARKVLADHGGEIAMRRLSRREYVHTLRDLLGVEPDVTYLPEDGKSGSFDTVGSALFMSSDQIEQYLAAGRRAMDDHFTLQAVSAAGVKPISSTATELPLRQTVRIEPESDVWLQRVLQFEHWLDAMETEVALSKYDKDDIAQKIRLLIVERNKTTGDQNARNGDLRAQYRLWDKRGLPPRVQDYGFKDFAEAERSYVMYYRPYLRLIDMPQLETGAYLTVSYYNSRLNFPAKKQSRIPTEQYQFGPGRYVLRVRCGATDDCTRDRRFVQIGRTYRESKDHPEQHTVLAAHEVLGSLAEPRVIEAPLRIGPNTDPSLLTFWIREKVHENAVPWRVRNGDDKPAIWVDWIEIEGPLDESLPEIFPANRGSEPESNQARAALERFATRAFRGKPVEPSVLDRLVGLFETRRKLGEPFDVAIRRPLSVVLASPSFLYLNERDESSTTTKFAPLGSMELASRLSYFLWSSPPDEELLQLARDGSLREPKQLDRQVTRMLADPRSMRTVEGFVFQWLSLDRLDFFMFDVNRYPYFDLSTRNAARSEVYETFADLLRNGRPLTELLKSDSAVLNGMLASYYGLSHEITGDEFRRVSLPPGSPRGGLLGMAAVMAMGSNGSNSSPVERGAWVLRQLLNDPPPPAPPNVPQISAGDVLGMKPRERLQKHQSEPQCASCHRKIDPIGFGLENFDAGGKWRDDDSLRPTDPRVPRWKIDSSGAFHNGPHFQDFFELREIIASQPDRFARGFTEALIQFALGRSVGFSDEEFVARILHTAKQQRYATDAFVRALVQSQEFQSK